MSLWQCNDVCCVFVVSDSAWMVFAGGMPRANFSDRQTVSVVHGSNHTTFDFSSRVVDFILMCRPPADDGVLAALKYLSLRVLSKTVKC